MTEDAAHALAVGCAAALLIDRLITPVMAEPVILSVVAAFRKLPMTVLLDPTIVMPREPDA